MPSLVASLWLWIDTAFLKATRIGGFGGDRVGFRRRILSNFAVMVDFVSRIVVYRCAEGGFDLVAELRPLPP